VTLTITDDNGEVIREFSSEDAAGTRPPVDAGTNRFVWNMRYPSAQPSSPAGALGGFQSVDHSPPAAPVAMPGRYGLRLTVDGASYEESFEIRMDPRVTTSSADLQSQFELMVALRDGYSRVVDTVSTIREVRAQVQARRAEAPEDLQAAADRILTRLREIEGVLMIWMGSEAHPMMWGPPGLTEKFSTLSGAVGAADAGPTESMYAVFEDLSERLEVQRDVLRRVIEEDVAPLMSR
jgi:hypothetical protein